MLFLQLFGDIKSFYKRSFGDYIQREIPSITPRDVESLKEVLYILMFMFVLKIHFFVFSYSQYLIHMQFDPIVYLCLYCTMILFPLQVFSIFDVNGNNVLTWDELMTIDIVSAMDKFPELFEKILLNVTDGSDLNGELGEDPEPIILQEEESQHDEVQRSNEDQSSKVKTPDDLEKEKLIEIADDGNLVMEEEPVRNHHEEL